MAHVSLPVCSGTAEFHGAEPGIRDESSDEEIFITLNNLGIVKKRDGVYTPTIAGILLFGKRPQNLLPQSKIKIDIISKENDKWEHIEDLEGTVYDQIDLFENFIKRNIKKTAKISGFRRIEEPQFPILVLREAIVNALVHRDYGDTTASTLVRIKDDNITIINPGGIIPPLTLETILSGHFNPRTRNEVVAEAILKYGYMERRGRGLLSIRNLMRTSLLPEPKFIEDGGSFVIELKSREMESFDKKICIPEEIWKDLKLDEYQRRILSIIETKGKAKLRDFEEGLGKTRGAFYKKIDFLLEENIIQRNPPKPLKSPNA